MRESTAWFSGCFHRRQAKTSHLEYFMSHYAHLRLSECRRWNCKCRVWVLTGFCPCVLVGYVAIGTGCRICHCANDQRFLRVCPSSHGATGSRYYIHQQPNGENQMDHITNLLSPGQSVILSSFGVTVCTAERSTDGKTLRFVRTTPMGFVVFRTCLF